MRPLEISNESSANKPMIWEDTPVPTVGAIWVVNNWFNIK